MKKLRGFIARSIITLAVLGVWLAVIPAEARAAVIVFEVDEGAVTGADDDEFDASGLTGKYLENLILTPTDATSGTFSATLVVEFASYTLGGTIADQIEAPTGEELGEENLYSLYALVTVEGTYTFNVALNAFFFEPEESDADIWTDPLRNTVVDHTTLAISGTTGDDDQHILTATTLDKPESFGATFLLGATTVIVGGYALVYTDVSLVDPTGPLYWPGLVGLQLTGTASGDVDPTSEGGVFPTAIRGDTSIAFNSVPEPASMTLFGMGLVGAAFAARRRRTE